MISRVWDCVPSQMLLQVDHTDHLDISQSTGHFFFRRRAGHLMPNSFGATMISRASVCQPPHPYGSNSSGQASSQLTEQSPGTQSVTPQSTIFSGGDSLLYFMVSARTST